VAHAFLAALLCFIIVPSAVAQVSGQVLDSSTMLAIPGAIVGVQATSNRTWTATDGSFTLPGAMGSNLVITGAAKGYFTGFEIATTPSSNLILSLDPVPQANDSTYVFASPSTCGACHPDQVAQWTDSPMSKAGTNTWVYDLYDGSGTPGGSGGWVYTRDSVHAAGNPHSECAACHQPEPWIASPFGPLDPSGNPSAGALHGVGCDVCHKIADIDESKLSFPGIFPGVVTLTRPQGPVHEQVQYGVLGDATFTRPTRMRPSYQPQLRAAVCAACHQDKNDPDQDGDFEEENGVLSEPTYLEWLASPYGDAQSPHYQDCVDCHMPPSGATTLCNSLDPPLGRDPQTIRHHRIEGTSAWFLENAASLNLQCQVLGDSLIAEVTVTNDRTGHHLPTGVTIRNIILRIEAWREDDGKALDHVGSQTIHALGGIGDPAQGFYAGLPGKLYAKHNHDAAVQGPVFFTEATGILWDNRIPALGSDVTRYPFLVPSGGGTLHVRARLIYRRSFLAITAAKGWTQDGHGNPLEDLQPPHFGHLMEQAEWSWQATSTADEVVSGRLVTTLKCFPNPIRSHTSIDFALSRPAAIRLAIYDLAGRRLATLGKGEFAAGRHRVEWKGVDEHGSSMAAGVYWCRLESPAGTTTRRMVLLR
jgi:hypothetical protein